MSPQASRPAARILAVGTELCIGQVADTNSRYLARELDALGFRMESLRAIPDDRESMRRELESAIAEVELTVVTGGLGPTDDDFTKSVLLEVFGGELVEDAATLRRVVARFEVRSLPLTDRNREQALVPSSCEVLANELGTAPGMLFRRGGHLLVSLPGVPFEMEHLFTRHVRPYAEAMVQVGAYHRNIHLYGVPESFLADELRDWERRLRPEFDLAYLPSPAGITLRLSSCRGDLPEVRARGDALLAELDTLLGERIYALGEGTMEGAVAGILRAEGLCIATAESCTGGRIAGLITSIPGSSSYFRGGVVSYTNRAKVELLGLDPDLLQRAGAVSPEVARAMAEGVRNRLGVDYALAVTGLLGPEGDGGPQPVGTVHLALASGDGTAVENVRVTATREINTQRVVYAALNFLRLMLLRHFPQHRVKIKGYEGTW